VSSLSQEAESLRAQCRALQRTVAEEREARGRAEEEAERARREGSLSLSAASTAKSTPGATAAAAAADLPVSTGAAATASTPSTDPSHTPLSQQHQQQQQPLSPEVITALEQRLRKMTLARDKLLSEYEAQSEEVGRLADDNDRLVAEVNALKRVSRGRGSIGRCFVGTC
jgi:hypothetical protein